jgi:hypothetical protein
LLKMSLAVRKAIQKPENVGEISASHL